MSAFRGDENGVSEIEAKLGPRKLLDILSCKLAWPRGNHLPSLAETPPAWVSGPGSVGHITTSSAGHSEASIKLIVHAQLSGSPGVGRRLTTIRVSGFDVSHDGEVSPRKIDPKKVTAQSTAIRITWPSGRRLKIAAARERYGASEKSSWVEASIVTSTPPNLANAACRRRSVSSSRIEV